MKLLLKSLVLLSIPFSVYAKPVNSFIVGGEVAAQGEFPFIASLHGRSGHFCGGTLIAKNWVLTAAHCVKGGSIAKVYIGLHSQKALSSGEVFTAAKVIAHSEYNAQKTDYDYALIKLSGDSKAVPALVNDEEIKIPVSADEGVINTVVAGWGVVKESSYSLPDLLQKVTVPLVDQETCNKSYKGNITNRMICAGLAAGGKDSCQGDSGGPLVIKNEDGSVNLVGVVSWGEGCARANKYGVYSKVNEVTSWIETQMSLNQ